MNPLLTSVPPGVVTIISPVELAGTIAVILVEDTTLNDVAAIPPKVTAVAPVKSVPVIVTVLPIAAVVGVNEVIDGAGIKVNPFKVALSIGVVTDTSPLVPASNTAIIVVGETTWNCAGVLPKVTVDALSKLIPVIVTVAPCPALVGVKEVMTGVAITDRFTVAILLPELLLAVIV